ncbi:hypothetical protein [Halomontanus rarus]|uniref:hypothetical protein n=1 Tax=Halomontanus rarus TaxID=3034020 RepID=UPI00307B9BC0
MRRGGWEPNGSWLNRRFLAIFLGGVILGILGVLVLTGHTGSFSIADADQPQIRDGSFNTPSSSGLLAVTSQACSVDSDCDQTTCRGSDYYVDTDASGQCVYDERDGEYVCGGYDKVYADAEICGGRYDYSCDGSGCDGYKAACEDDCSANSGCDTYDFCADDDDDSSSGGGSNTGSDACEQYLTKCDGDQVVQCQDTDSDGYTDGFVVIDECDGNCENAVCTAPQETRWFPAEDGTDCVTQDVPESSTDGYESEQACLDTLTDDTSDSTDPDDDEPREETGLVDRTISWLTHTWSQLTGWFSS